MLNTRQNFHHSKLPTLGAVGYLIAKVDRYRGAVPLIEGKFIVESFPLCDNVRPWSVGIHTVNVRRLSDGARFNVSGFYFDQIQ